jgi:PiT family inorganic phosphate transporter
MAKDKTKGISQDLKRVTQLQKASSSVSQDLMPAGLAIVFLMLVFISISGFTCQVTNNSILILAGILGGYMALNIGANDVANNVGPAVGSKALSMMGALILAAIFESAGAIIAGGEVVSTISKGIINADLIENSVVFISLMFSALLAAALWLNLATWLSAPVSTTHSIVGGVLGGGVAAAGIAVVNWPTMAKIAASWVISPVLGGVIAALIFAFIKAAVLNKNDKLAAAKTWVPVLVAIMSSAFTMYIMMKGLKKIWKPEPNEVWLAGIAVLILLPILLRPFVSRKIATLENKPKSVNTLFTLPLIVSACLLSFAHGANDVANAIGPLAAIVSTVSEGGISTKVGIPLWVLAIGAVGISVGLLLFGSKIIRTVGDKITKLDQVRAFCIALSAALTVILATTLGLPVSSTHIAVGGVFGVGLYREFISHKKRTDSLKARKQDSKKLIRRKIVRRNYLLSIAAAWIITVPCAAALSAAIYGLLYYLKFSELLIQ